MVCGPLGSSVRALTQAAQLGEGGDGLALREDGDEHGDRGEQAHDRERDRARRRVHDLAKAPDVRAWGGESAVLARLQWGGKNGKALCRSNADLAAPSRPNWHMPLPCLELRLRATPSEISINKAPHAHRIPGPGPAPSVDGASPRPRSCLGHAWLHQQRSSALRSPSPSGHFLLHSLPLRSPPPS